MNNLTLSKRAKKAWHVLENGGFFRHALERNSYTGREQFQTRLYDNNKRLVRNIGIKTRFELEDLGLLKLRDCPKRSTWPTEYVANFGAGA